MPVIVQQWISLDGFAAGPDDEEAIFAAVEPGADARSEHYNERLVPGVDAVLLGRRTYERFAAFWPTAQARMAPAVNAAPKRVASTTLTDAPWGDHAPVAIERDPVGWLRGSEARVLVWGSLALTAALHREGFVDELDLFVAPVLLGAGTPLLPGRARLEQLDAEDWGDVAHLRYAVRR